MAQFRKGTPNSGLELFFNCPPLEVYLTKMATKSYFRTIKHAPYTSEQLETSVESRTSHRTWIKKLINDYDLTHLESPLDEVPLHRRWDRKFEVDLCSMHPENPLRGVPDPKGVNLFTDGSKDKGPNKGNTGAGVVVTIDNKVSIDTEGKEKIYKYHLEPKTTVFQSEVFALKMAATLILNGTSGAGRWVTPFTKITINSDSQASLLALNNVWVKSKLVKETLDLMDRAADNCSSLTLRWVRSHVGHSGNVLADTAAREAKDDIVTPDWEAPLLSKAVMHAEIDKMAEKLWCKTWNEVVGCRQTRHFYPTGPRPSFYKSIINLPKPIVSQLVQLITGHTYLKRHQAVIDESERQLYLEALDWDNADDDGNAVIDAADPKCSRCLIGDETPLHLLSECTHLAKLRLRIFGREDLVGPREIPDFSDLPAYKLIAFFREANFASLTMLPLRSQYLPTNTSNEDSNKSLRREKEKGDEEGKEWTSHYLFHVPLKRVFRKKKKKKKNTGTDNINGVENEGDGNDDIMMNQGTQDDTIDRIIDSQDNNKRT